MASTSSSAGGRSTSPSPSRSSRRPSSTPRSASSSASSSSAPGADAAKLPLVVLNNTTTNGLATRAADRFKARGWTVTDIGNLTDDILSSAAYYDPSVSGARAAARELQREFPAVQRVVEKFDGLPAGPVVVVLTPDWPDS